MRAPMTVSSALSRLVGRGGGAPLVTWYGPAGERTELSVISFANWVDKTANLLDDLGLDADARVALPVLLERPGHWMALVWPFALWQRGLAARVADRSAAADADLAVVGQDAPAPVAAETLACSLHPMGLALQGLPPGVSDFSSEALAQPDAHAEVPGDPDAVAWSDADRELTFGQLAALNPRPSRVLTRPDDAWASVSALARAVLGAGSLVVVEAPASELDAIAAAERARPIAER